MNGRTFFGLVVTLAGVLFFGLPAVADTHYVSPSGSHTLPFTNWPSAATNIQAAIDAASSNDTVLVADGVYDTGGMVVHGNMTNRIAIIKAITVRSLNGPDHTIIMGKGPSGDAAVRCAYVGANARLEGFTLTNGHTRTTGDLSKEQSGGGAWCEPTAVVSGCVISGNDSYRTGGGTCDGTVENCTVRWNTTWGVGGGTCEGTILQCSIYGNTARLSGGGVYKGTIRNCSVIDNASQLSGGGAHQSIVQSCTIIGNTSVNGGGTSLSTVQNSIVYYNTGVGHAANISGGTVEFTCTTPDPGGVSVLTNAPGIAGLNNPYLVDGSPCIDAGTNQGWMTPAVDLDREPRIGNGLVDVGCDEFYSGSLTGALDVAVLADYTNVHAGVAVKCSSTIHGRPSGYRWLWEGGVVHSNTACSSHVYDSPGDFDVIVEAWNPSGSASATLTVHVVAGYTNYVSLAGSHVPPYGSWAAAATNIQAAIDAHTTAGGVVLVADGVYDDGGAVVHGSVTNRISITRPVTVRSISGPQHTFIVGKGPSSLEAVRCAYVGEGARLEGFTLTNGHTSTGGTIVGDRHGGGAWCEPTAVVSNCILTGNGSAESAAGIHGGIIQGSTILGNHAIWYGGGAYESEVTHCTISSNSASRGGGAFRSIVSSSTITSNRVEWVGGGAYEGSLVDCVVSANTADVRGGGVYGSTVRDSLLSGNASGSGGGMYRGTAENCTISANLAHNGGGAFQGTLRNCAIVSNQASYGGGTSRSTNEHCTVYANSAEERGGGSHDSVVRNCVLYYNAAQVDGANWHDGSFEFTCTTPGPGGIGNITSPPGFVSMIDPHIVAGSPCVDAGSNQAWTAAATDMDGEPRIAMGTVDMGCDEYWSNGRTGVLEVACSSDYTNLVAGHSVTFQAYIEGRPEGYRWLSGDGSIVSNGLTMVHRYDMAGDYDVILDAWNLDGVGAATLTVHVVAGYTNYASPAGAHVAPYDSWATAATNLQAAVAANTYLGGMVLVSNGVYDTGGVVVHELLTSRIAISRAITICSLNGPEVTHIVGQGPQGEAAVRCAYVGDGARLQGFTLTRGHTATNGSVEVEQRGGGAWCEESAVVSDCIISGNAAYHGGGVAGGTVEACLIVSNDAYHGGGAYKCTVRESVLSGNTASLGGGANWSDLRNCLMTGNQAWVRGGGAYSTDLESCTVCGNTAWYYGGGISGGTILNSIVYYNHAVLDQDNCSGGSVDYCCTMPDPGGVGNTTNAPGLAGLANPMLTFGSPCVEAGLNQAWMTGAFDLGGEPRIAAGTVDIGCDELHVAGLVGGLSAVPGADFTSALPGLPIRFEVELDGCPSGYTWDWGDGSTTTNIPVPEHAYQQTGTYRVVFQAWNLEQFVTTGLTIHVVAGHTNYVSPAGAHVAPFESWASAATNIQDAVAAQTTLGGVVMVDDGVYDNGGAVVHATLSNRVAVTRRVTVRSLNGPGDCLIVGRGPIGDTGMRCAYVGEGATLEGFALTNGHTRQSQGGLLDPRHAGGGVWCHPDGVVSNCVIAGNQARLGGGTSRGVYRQCVMVGNHAYSGGGGHHGGVAEGCLILQNSASSGGGTDWATLRNCAVVSNTATSYGGGAENSTLENCTVVGNTARRGGGASFSTVSNSIVYFNEVQIEDANLYQSESAYACTSPLGSGVGNIDADPLFLDARKGNYRLSLTSPCLDAGLSNAWMEEAIDRGGFPRIIGPTVDMGAYEGSLQFAWSAVGATQWVDNPLPVSVAALHPDGSPALFFAGPAEVHAVVPGQTPGTFVVGDGTNDTQGVFGLNGWSSRAQIIYPADLLPGAFDIASLALDVVSPPANALENWTLRMKHTELDEFGFSPRWDGDGWMIVYQADEVISDPGWHEFPFDRVFEYNGVSNLMLDISTRNGSEGTFRGTAGDLFHAEAFYHQYGIPTTDPLTWSGYWPRPTGQLYLRPNLRLGVLNDAPIPLALAGAGTVPFLDGTWAGVVLPLEVARDVNLLADYEGYMGTSTLFDIVSHRADFDADGIDDDFELTYFHTLTNLSFDTDWDGDQFRDGFEFHAGTIPVDDMSYLGITHVAVNPAGTETVIKWSSESNRLYTIHCSTNLAEGLDLLLGEHIPATPPENIHTDAVGDVESRSYGVEVEIQP